ncbi:hypothetical protein WN943_018227 [Citrus x changshan-huyou]
MAEHSLKVSSTWLLPSPSFTSSSSSTKQPHRTTRIMTALSSLHLLFVSPLLKIPSPKLKPSPFFTPPTAGNLAAGEPIGAAECWLVMTNGGG